MSFWRDSNNKLNKIFWVSSLIIILNIGLFVMSRQSLRKEIKQTIQIEFSDIQRNLQSALTVMVLDTNLVNSVEQLNYAESMKTMMTYREAKVADSLLILKVDQNVYADSDTMGAFGQPSPLPSSLSSPHDLNEKFQTMILERKGNVYLFTSTQLRSLNGVIGTIAAGENLEAAFKRLGQQEVFAIKALQFLKSQEITDSSWDKFNFDHLEAFQMPKSWRVQAYVPALRQLVIYYLAQTVLMLILAIGFLSIWKKYHQVRTNLKREQVLRINSARLVALGEMSAGIAHEINTPLAVIQMNADQLNSIMELFPLPVEFQLGAGQVIDRILKMTERINIIVKGLKSFSRDGSQESILPTNLKSVINETLGICMSRIKSKEVDLRLNLDGFNEEVHCRAVQISQVLLNLLNNAYDAVEATPSPWIAIDLFQKGEFAEIWITDSGNGISPELVLKVMEPFYTTKPVGQGTGIGLSIATGILQDHGGTLRVDSNCPNTRFIMQIPIKASVQSKSFQPKFASQS